MIATTTSNVITHINNIWFLSRDSLDVAGIIIYVVVMGWYW